MEIEAKHGTMGRNLHDSAAARLERFREYWGGPPVVEGRGFLVARAQKKAEHLVVVCLPWATHPLWVMLELRDGSRWAERTSDLLSRHLQADISARDLLDAAPVAVPKGNAWFVTRTMGTVALPAAWFDGFETLPGGPDALDYKSPWLVLRGLSGYVDVFDTANKKNLLAQMGYKGWRNVKSVELREGVNRLPQSAQGGDAPYVKLWNGTDWKAMGLEEHRVPPRPKTVRAWIVKRGSRFVAVIEHGGPIRNAETSTEALVRFFDGELLRALK